MDAQLEFLISQKPHALNLGTSFKRKPLSAFHTLRYDFKPASVDKTKEGCIEVGDSNEVTVTLPHVAGSKTSCTVYKGSKKPVQKECILIYDNRTGEFTLERISSQLQVKKTRVAGNLPQNTTVLPPGPKIPKLGSKKQTKPRSNFVAEREVSPVKPPSPPVVKQPKISLTPPPLPKDSDEQHIMEADLKVSEDMLNAINSQDDSGSSGSSSSDSTSSSSSDSEDEVADTNQSELPSGNLQNDLLLSDSGSDSD